VILSGGNQLITGTQTTLFYNLDLEGVGIKTQTINAQVNGILHLRDAELATDIYDMWVANNDNNAINRNTGFVSSLQNGKLLRSTNSSNDYIFPTGSSLGTLRYRPIIIAPNATNNHIYGARLANVDATTESFDRNTKVDALCIINPNFYHRLYQTTGNDAANITMLYDALQDGGYATMAHWQNIPQWEDMNGIITNTLGFDAVQVNNWTDFSASAFALANAKSFVTAFSDTTILIGQSAPLFTTISNNVNSYSWFPDVALSCNDCPNPVASPQQTTLYVVTINEGNECAHSDSVLVKVQADLNVWIPSAFTPNGDGQNETLKVFGNLSNLKSIDFKIFNRWGEKVFEALDTATAAKGWDGTYLGKLQDSGVFTYAIRAFYTSDIASGINDKGSITLIR
jgi:gliding motility-associated-like protein